jgi:hypothetical protein
MKYIGGIFSHIRRQLQLHGVKMIDETSKKDVYIGLECWTPIKDNITWDKKKPSREEIRR